MDHHGSTSRSIAVAEVVDWLRIEVSRALDIPLDRVDSHARFKLLGLDSARVTAIVAKLGRWIGRPLAITMAWQFPTIDALARHVASGDLPESAPDDTHPVASNITRADEPIAVIGIGCRFAGAVNSAASYWRLLREGRDAVTEVPKGRWDVDAYVDVDPRASGKMRTRRGAFIDHVDAFDAAFFGISPREAMEMDPQQRLMLELSWEALEDAAIVPDALRGSLTGVFMGAMWSDYSRLASANVEQIVTHTATGQDTSIVAARVSYTLGLEGPSLVVNTACSSSLVAVHLACQSLRNGESTMALAGGVNLILSPHSTVAMTKFGGMAPDGRCKAFDARADGYVRGEGGGVVVLKPLSRALADGDAIYCVLLGSAVNNDGFSNGLTAPNPKAQERVLRDAYARAGVEPSRAQYVEAHGTGTLLGDPIEAGALGAVLGAGRGAEQALRIGSVKTNLGHTEAAAGIAGLIKVALAMKHRTLPRTLHFETPNPHIAFEALHLEVQRELGPWPAPAEPLVAGVSSFGFGGTNCHVVLRSQPESTARWVAVSADTPAELTQRMFALVAAATASREPEQLERLCQEALRDAGTGKHRVALVGDSPADVLARLSARLKEGPSPATRAEGDRSPSPSPAFAQRPRLVFVCSGNGPQWLGMGRSLLQSEPVFRAKLMDCDRLVRALTGWSLIDELIADEKRSRLHRVDVVQPLLCSMQIAVGTLWRSWGIEPDALIGHSSGEIAACHLAGTLSLEDAMRVICGRSRLALEESGQGGMIVVPLSADEALEAVADCAGSLTVAAYNSPTSTVLSGDAALIESALHHLHARGVDALRINVDYASHCPRMDALEPRLIAALAGMKPARARLRVVSTVTCEDLEGPECGPEYWARNLRQPVRFLQAIEKLLDEGETTFLELSPHPVLLRGIQQTLSHREQTAMTLASLTRNEDERACMLEALAALYTSGVDVSFEPFAPAEAARSPHAPSELLVLSAQSAETLRAVAERARAHLLGSPELALSDICFTAATRRAHHKHRLAVTGHCHTEIAERLQRFVRGESSPAFARSGEVPADSDPKIAFVFSGEAARWRETGRQLVRDEPVFREAVEQCEARLRRHVSWSLRDELTGALAEDSRMQAPDVAPPALFTMQFALASLWQSWGVVPAAVIGEGIGGLAAACVAGALSLDDAIALAVHRGISTSDDALSNALAAITPQRGSLPFFSAATGGRVPEEAMTGAYWAEQLRAAAKLDEALGAAISEGCSTLLEIGTAPALLAGVRERVGSRAISDAVVESVQGAGDERQALLDSLGALYVRGRAALFERLHPAAGRRIVPLPSYPWQRKRYWVETNGAPSGDVRELGAPKEHEEVAQTSESSAKAPPDATHEPVAHPFFELAWRPQPRSPGAAPPGDAARGSWLILADRGGVGATLGALLEARGESCTVVTWRSAAAPAPALANDDGAIDPRSADDMVRLVNELSERGGPPLRGIVHLWSLDVARPGETDASRLIEDQTLGCGSVAHLIRALANCSAVGAPRLWLVTRGVHRIRANDAVNVGPSALWGLGRVLAQEQPETWGGLVDLSQGWSGDEVAHLRDEILAPDGDDQIALRGGDRHVLRLVSCREEGPRAFDSARSLAFRSDATYLITGGLGALGIEVARWMVARGARHLVLVGRSSPPPATRAVLRELEDAGARVSVASADVSDKEQLARVLATARESMPALRGVIHSAAVMDDALGIRLKWEQFERVFAPKLAGAWNLHELTRDTPLDFFVLFSSIASLMGLMSLGSYASANSALDALAHHRRGQGLPALSVNWPVWDKMGLGLRLNENLRKSGVPSITADQGLGALARLLAGSSASAQVAVLPTDWSQAFLSVRTGRGASVYAELAPDAMPTPTPSAKMHSPRSAALLQRIERALPTERERVLRAHVRQEVAEVLRFDDATSVDENTRFFRLGLDSLGAMELKNRLQIALGRKLPATVVFDHPTVAKLCAYIHEAVMPGARADSSAAHAVAAAPNVTAGAAPSELAPAEPIAIVGMGCRLPGGAESPAAFWELLRSGVDAITEVPKSRWDAEALHDPRPGTPGKAVTRRGGFLRDVETFDARFFSISPREAASMDPQQRLLLEVSWEALETAGLASERLAGSKTGVFIGMSSGDYAMLRADAGAASLDNFFSPGTLASVAAGRLAYTLGLKGPAMVVDTACASSLTAVHLAVQSLRSGECTMALAGGVNLMMHPLTSVALSQLGLLSPDGRCKSFDASADGFVRSEGCGVVVLKRLSDALAEGDRILAVIRGSAVNQGGSSVGLTAPNGPAQEAVIQSALANAGVDASLVTYVEAHGTGTALGDAIELGAFTAVLGDRQPSGHPLSIGSVKTNIGHLEAASGIASLIKVVLSLQHGQIPGNLHFTTANPDIDLEKIPAIVPTALTDWTPRQGRRIAGVHAFGISGANAHVICEEAPSVLSPRTEIDRPAHVLALSAQREVSLCALADRYAEHLASSSDALADICFSANAGRSHFEHRLAVVVTSPEDARDKLRAFARGERPAGLTAGAAAPDRRRVAFLFSGEGSQYVGMGSALYAAHPAFRGALDRCAELLGPSLGRPLLELLYPSPGADSPLGETAYSQPALFALEYALAELWRSFGVTPSAVLGCGVGELVAACVTGVFALEDGLALAVERGRWMAAASHGSATAVRDPVARFDRVRISPPNIALVSSATGTTIERDRVPDAAEWCRPTREPLPFLVGLRALVDDGYDLFVELGPDAALTDAGAHAWPGSAAAWLPSLKRDRDDWESFLSAVAAVYTAGVTIDWAEFDAAYRRRRVALPTYPFLRKRFWFDVPAASGATSASAVPTTSDAGEPARRVNGHGADVNHAPELDFNSFVHVVA